MRKEPGKAQLNAFVPIGTKRRLINLAKRLDTTQAALLREMIEERYQREYQK